MERSHVEFADGCPDAGTLAQLAAGELGEADVPALQRHFDRCPRCRAVMVTVVKMADPDVPAEDTSDAGPRTLRPGQQVGRYVVEGIVGTGGSGVVYRAHDEELQRAVALKLLWERDGSVQEHESADGRLRREARALAQLDHPGIVYVYEIGSFAGATFMAMALVDGESLREWLEGGPSRAAIIDVFVQAARALAAAHGQGLVHRDFKPENVMVDRTGRVRVMDFGLVRDTETRLPPEAGPSDTQTHAADSQITRSGTVAGTPAYMAPEQFAGARVGPAADQFAWCVCLHEALLGVRPFAGRTTSALADAVHRGERVATSRAAPRAIERILRRGLNPDPTQRFATMEACAAALHASRGANRRRAVVAIGVGGCVVAGVVLWPKPTDPRCEAGTEHPWARREAELEAAMSGFAAPFGQQTWERAAPRVQAYVDAVEAMRQSVCRDADGLGHPLGDPLADPRRDATLRCLDHRDARLNAVVSTWAEPSHSSVAAAIDVIAALPTPEGCADAPPLAAATAATHELDAAVATAHVQLQYGQHRVGLATLAPWVGVPIDPPRDVSMHALRGKLAGGAGDDELAQAELKRAADLAAELGDDHAVADAFIARIAIAADRDVDQDYARSLCDLADVAVTRAGDDPLLRAGLLQACAGIEFRSARWAEAERLQRDAATRLEQALGANHPKLARALINLGSVLRQRGDFDGAIAAHERALSIAAASYGPAHPVLAKVEGALGADYGAKEDLDEARVHLERALAIFGETLPEDHRNVVSVQADLGRVERELGNLDEAEALAERVVALRRAAGGVRFANALTRRASVRLEGGDVPGARADFAEAAQILEAEHGLDYPPMSGALVGLAECALAQDDHAAAVTPLRRALALRQQTSNQPVLASIEFLLAKALWGEGGKRHEALTLARSAATRYRSVAPDHAESGTAVQAWLSAHGPISGTR